jgi:hypothetical protein
VDVLLLAAAPLPAAGDGAVALATPLALSVAADREFEAPAFVEVSFARPLDVADVAESSAIATVAISAPAATMVVRHCNVKCVFIPKRIGGDTRAGPQGPRLSVCR